MNKDNKVDIIISSIVFGIIIGMIIFLIMIYRRSEKIEKTNFFECLEVTDDVKWCYNKFLE